MRFSKNIALSLVVVTGVVLANVAFYTERYPALFTGEMSDKERETLGCIDHSAFALMDHFRDAANLKYETQVPHAAKLNWLQKINADASAELGKLGDCYDELLALDDDLDTDRALKAQIETIIDLYEPIFVGEAVNLSKTIREMVGISSPPISPSPVRMPAVDSKEFIDKASNAVNVLSAEIGRKVVVR
jgi:hypothetical protein